MRQHHGCAVEPITDEQLNSWLAEAGIDGERRIVRESEHTVLVSKFPPGFAHALVDRVEGLTELFADAVIQAAYERVAAESPGSSRAATWHQASLAVLRELAERDGLDRRAVAEVEAGIDSVAALLDTVLFMGEPASSEVPATAAEARAYEEALAKLDSDAPLFTRQYGVLDGKTVVNHCPGSRFARLLFEQGWRLCSGARR